MTPDAQPLALIEGWNHSAALTWAYGPSLEEQAMIADMEAERDGELRAEWFYSGGNPDDAGAFAHQWVRTNGTMIEGSV